MTALLMEIARWTLFLFGAFFVLVGALGVIRLPDIYSRLHAAGLADSLGAALLLLAMMIGAEWLIVVKLGLILLILLITGPTATHALARAARAAGAKPLLADSAKRKKKE